MTRRIWMMLALSASLAATATAWGHEAAKKAAVQVVVELADGSRLVGTPLDQALHVKLDFMTADIPLAGIKQCEVRPKDERVTIHLKNGDRLTGTLEVHRFKLETVLGKLSAEFAQIDRLTFTTGEKESSPAEKGSIEFGGLNWLPWKTLFEVQGDKLATVPKARPGFNYGHGGSERGPTLMSNIGNPDWKDYCIEFDYCVTGVDPSFNPYGLGSDYHDGAMYFHVVDAKENWNQCGSSMYALTAYGNGTWQLVSLYNAYCQVPVGYGNVT